ncbi:hydroxypyruvate isomerase family protein [Massilia sp. RP-1-19]|uniref:Hydroxypyruvate isomerase family protein n=1 Tax=Massilia polaris TaxID=2728846 RepID=A0A848HJY5_9BURK|nr:2-oxo-tetronate isomerase [Massilia polaris]NML61725.1 hydroxypyruvate isomerase family protein [Massilia polaris]
MPKLAANLSTMFTEVAFLDRFAAARESGFDAVEFQFPYAFIPAQLSERLERARLHLVMHNMPPGDWDAGDRGMACDPDRIDEFQDSVELALEYAVALGVRQLHCMAGIVPPGVSHDKARATYLANLKFAANKLHPRAIRVLIEPINSHDLPGYFLSGSQQAAAIIADCGAPNLFLQYDIYHLPRMEGGVAESLRALFPLIRHVQLADVPGRHEPGSGGIDFAPLFALLDELGYDGWVGCEYFPANDTVGGLGWRERLLPHARRS